MLYRFEEMADQRGSELGPVNVRNLTKTKLFTTFSNSGLITKNDDFASGAESPTAKRVPLEAGKFPFERFTGSKEG
jgi:hypothetical protein